MVVYHAECKFNKETRQHVTGAISGCTGHHPCIYPQRNGNGNQQDLNSWQNDEVDMIRPPLNIYIKKLLSTTS
jgi:hypothetical protein